MKLVRYLFSIVFILTLFSCKKQAKISHEEIPTKISAEANKVEMRSLMEKHLNAVSQKDLVTLKTTMSPRGDMQLILPGSEIINGVDGFIKYHEEWFAVDNGWTFETKILNTKTGDTFGMAVVEIVYREPERNGFPYFNRMTVSYVLEKIDNTWYVVKDHASSIEKSTDPE